MIGEGIIEAFDNDQRNNRHDRGDSLRHELQPRPEFKLVVEQTEGKDDNQANEQAAEAGEPLGSVRGRSSLGVIKTPTTKLMKIAMPPVRAIRRACWRRPPGSSAMLRRSPSLAASGVSSRESMKEMRKTKRNGMTCGRVSAANQHDAPTHHFTADVFKTISGGVSMFPPVNTHTHFRASGDLARQHRRDSCDTRSFH